MGKTETASNKNKESRLLGASRSAPAKSAKSGDTQAKSDESAQSSD